MPFLVVFYNIIVVRSTEYSTLNLNTVPDFHFSVHSINNFIRDRYTSGTSEKVKKKKKLKRVVDRSICVQIIIR